MASGCLGSELLVGTVEGLLRGHASAPLLPSAPLFPITLPPPEAPRRWGRAAPLSVSAGRSWSLVLPSLPASGLVTVLSVIPVSAASGEEEEVWDRPSSHCFLNVPSKVMEKMSLSPFSQGCHGGSDLSCLRICVEVTGALGADGFTGSGWLRVYGVR